MNEIILDLTANMSTNGSENSVSNKKSMETARHGLQMVTLNGKIFALGGNTAVTNGTTNKCETYDPKTDSWTPITNMITARSYFGAIASSNKIYVFAGQNNGTYLNTCEVYDPTTDKWTSIAQMPQTNSLFGTAFNETTQKVYITGGFTGAFKNAILEYEILTNIWKTLPNLSTSIAEHTSFYYKNKIYIEGGFSATNILSGKEFAYDIETGTTSTAVNARDYLASAASVLTHERFISIGGKNATQYSSNIIHSTISKQNDANTGYYVTNSHLPTAKAGLAACIINNKVYIAGGINDFGVTQTLEVMDLGWTEKTELPISLIDYKTVECNGKIFVMGGYCLENEHRVLSKAIYSYNILINNWEKLCDMPFFAKEFTLCTAYNDIFFAGGLISETLNGTYEYSKKIMCYSVRKNEWTEKNVLHEAKSNVNSVFLNGMLYFLGGNNDLTSKTVEKYNPFHNTVTMLRDLPRGIRNHYATVLNGDITLFSEQISYKYDELQDKWSELDITNIPFGNLLTNLRNTVYSLGNENENTSTPSFYQYSALDDSWATYKTFNYFGNIQKVITSNNKILMFTGEKESIHKLIEYSPATDPWLSKKDCPVFCHSAAAVTVGQYIYVAGGQNDNNQSIFYKDLYCYDTITDTWETKVPMTYARSGLALAAVGNKIFALGGKSTTSTISNVIEQYNTTTNTWENKISLGALTDFAISVFGNNIYIFGGRNASGTPLNTVYQYDTISNTLTTKAAMSKAVYGTGAAIIDGKIYVVGGFTLAGDKNPTNSCFAYDPVANTWTAKESIPTPLAFAGVVADKTLHVIGGFDGYNELAYSYDYSPETNKWNTWTGMDTPKYNTATVLTETGMYVIGGKNINQTFCDVSFIAKQMQISEAIHMGKNETNVSGNYSRRFTDLEVDGLGFELSFSRTYNSRETKTNGLFGSGFSCGLLSDLDFNGNEISVRLPNGGNYSFIQKFDGLFAGKDSRNNFAKNKDNTYTLTMKNLDSYDFSEKGKLLNIKDRHGNAIKVTATGTETAGTISYDGLLTVTIAQVGSPLVSRVTKLQDKIGRTVTYTYANDGKLSKITFPMGETQTYTYNADGYMSQIVSPTIDEKITYFTGYADKLPKMKTLTDNITSNTTTYEYDSGQLKLTATDTNNRKITTWYDSSLYPIFTIDADGVLTKTEYEYENGFNCYGEAKTITDRNGNTFFYERDEKGNVIKEILPDLSCKTFKYDENSNLIAQTDEINNKIEYIYDDNKINLLKRIEWLNETESITTVYEYTEKGETPTVLGQLKCETNAEGGKKLYTYDSDGHNTSFVDENGNKQTFLYNAIGWITSKKTPDGNETTYYYDKNGNMLKEIKSGNVTRFVYDEQFNLKQKIAPNQYDKTFDSEAVFDVNNVQTSAKNGYLQTTSGFRYVRNKAGFITSETNPLDIVTTFSYDIYGNKLKEMLPNSTIYTFDYDKLNRIISASFKENETSAEILLSQTDYTIENNGNTKEKHTEYTDKTACSVTYTIFDYANRIVEKINADDSKEMFEYNQNGTLKRATNALNMYTEYQYNGLNRLIHKWEQSLDSTVKLENQANSSDNFKYEGFIYDKTGNVVKTLKAKNLVEVGYIPTEIECVCWENKYFPNGLIKEKSSQDGAKQSYIYDGENNVIQEETLITNDEKSVIKYQHNHLQQVTQTTQLVKNKDIFQYLSNDETLELTNKFVYDSVGNLIKSTDALDTKTTYIYDLLGRKISTTFVNTDEDGNRIKTTTKTTYNWKNQPLTQTNQLGNTTAFEYDLMMNCVKTIDPENNYTLFDYDLQGRNIAEVSPNNANPDKTFDEMEKTTFKVDKMGRIVQKTNGVGSVLFEYDAMGNLTKQTDALGNITTSTYNSDGQVLTIQDPVSLERGLTFTILKKYDGLGNLSTETDANGNTTKFEYNANGQVLKITALGADTYCGVLQENAYDFAGNLTSQTDANGNTIKITTNALGKPRSKTMPEDASIEKYSLFYRYNKNGLLAYQNDSLNQEIIIEHDNMGNVLCQSRRKKGETMAVSKHFSYDKCGNVLTETDEDGVITTFCYDKNNRLVATEKMVKGIKKTETNSYDRNGNVIQSTNWLGNTRQNVYDDFNRITQKIDALSIPVETIKYNANNQQISSIDALGNETTFAYDNNSRLISTTDPLGVLVSQTYDNVGNVVKNVDGNGNITEKQYNCFRKLLSIKDTNGNTLSSYKYDLNGNLISQTDGNGNTTQYSYNCRNVIVNRLDMAAEQLKNQQTYAYLINENNQSTVSSETIFKDNMIYYKNNKEGIALAYDLNLGALVQIDSNGKKIIVPYTSEVVSLSPTNAEIEESRKEEYKYSPDGKLYSKVDKNNSKQLYNHDNFGNVSAKISENEAIYYTYDKTGRMLTMTDKTGKTTMTYDEQGRITAQTTQHAQDDNLSALKTIIEHDITLNENNSKICILKGFYGEKTIDAKGNVLVKVYNQNGQLNEVWDFSTTSTNDYTKKQMFGEEGDLLSFPLDFSALSDATQYSYFNDGSLKSVICPSQNSEHYEYYKNKRLKTLKNCNKYGATVEEYVYKYDNNGNVLEIADSKGVTTYEYDHLNRLVNSVDIAGKNTAYTYDNGGNRSTETIILNRQSTETIYSYDFQNRLTKSITKINGETTKETIFLYDNNGNLLNELTKNKIATPSNSVVLYEYDKWNNLTKTTNDQYTVENEFNGFGLRVKKVVNTLKTDAFTPIQETNYVYLGSKVILELDMDNNEAAVNIYGNKQISRKTKDAGTQFYRFNGHGDVIAILDVNGEELINYTYNSFGVCENEDLADETQATQNETETEENTLETEQNGTTESVAIVANPHRYAGYTYDKETGLYYLQSRFYNPAQARFLQQDSVLGKTNDPLSLHLYTYCKNNPISYYDPTGHVTVDIPIKGKLIVANSSNNTYVSAGGSTVVTNGTIAQGSSFLGSQANIIANTGGSANVVAIRPAVEDVKDNSSKNSSGITSNNSVKVTTTPTPTVIANPGTPVKVTLPSGKEVIATIKDGKTYMPDGSRPEAGSIVHTSGGDYKMTTSGVGVLLPTTKNTTSANTTAQTGQIGVIPKSTASTMSEKKIQAMGNHLNNISSNNTQSAYNPSLATITGWFGNGVEIIGETGAYYLPKWNLAAPRPNNIGIGAWAKMVAKEMTEDAKFTKNVITAGKYISYAGTVIDVGSGVWENIENNAPAEKIVNDAAVDATWSISGGIIGSAVAGATAGAFAGTSAGTAVPGIGNVAGAVAGTVVGALWGVLGNVVVDNKTVKQHMKEMPGTPNDRPNPRFSLN